jgi:hypothetical protein
MAFGAFTSAHSMAPGLWEHAMTMKSGGGELDASMAKMQKELAALPPDQRKMVEEMMSKQGVGVGGAGKPITTRVCVSAEMAARNEMPQNDAKCRQESVQRSGNTVRFKFACSGDPPGRGEGEYTFNGDKAYSGRTIVDTVVKGKPERMEMQMQGRHLGTDCGALKPQR